MLIQSAKTVQVRIPEPLAKRLDNIARRTFIPGLSRNGVAELIIADGIGEAEARYIGGKLPKKGAKQ